jgi:uncharacterized membrane protein YdjX (TVP38/TMEM64 family)
MCSKLIRDQEPSPTWWQIPLALLVLGVYAVTIWYYFSRYDTVNHENVQAFIRGFDAWAPLAYATLYVVSSPIPFLGMTLSIAGGFLFGQMRGTIYAILLATFSSLIPFSMARRVGRDWAMRKIESSPRLNGIYQDAVRSNDFRFIFLLRLIPIVPWEMQNYIAGLTPISIPKFLIATALGSAPGTFLLVFLGASITDATSPQFRIALALNGAVLLIAASVALVQRQKQAQTKE